MAPSQRLLARLPPRLHVLLPGRAPPYLLFSPVQNVGRQGVCYYQYLTAKRAQTGVFLDVALNDYFVIEPVDGYPYQMRIRSMVRGRPSSSSSGGCAGVQAPRAASRAGRRAGT